MTCEQFFDKMPHEWQVSAVRAWGGTLVASYVAYTCHTVYNHQHDIFQKQHKTIKVA